MILQCQWEMFVCGLDRDDVVAAIAGMPPASWTVYRDQAIIDDLRIAADRFWQRVITRTPPPIDHHDDWAERFAKRLGNRNGLVLASDSDTDELAGQLREVRDAERALEKKRKHVENEIKGRLSGAGADALEADGGLITWHQRAGQVSWKATAEKLATEFHVTDLASRIEATRGDPTRTFSVPRSWGKETT